MTMSAADFLRALEKARGGVIAVAAHVHPDGDAIASFSVMVSVLRERGFNAVGIFPEVPPDSYGKYLPREGVVKTPEGLKNVRLFIVLDCAAPARVAAGGFDFLKVPEILCIDHHAYNEQFASQTLIRPEACATAEVLFKLFRECGFPISAENASRLLLGVVTDTGCFRFDNTGADALETGAELIRLGGNHRQIVMDSFFSRKANLVRLEADLILNHMKTAFDGRLAWVVLSRELLNRYGVEVRNTETLIEAVRQLEGLDFAALFREEPGSYKLSMRSKNPAVSAGKIARALGGGGHEMASGATIPASSIEEAEAVFLKTIKPEFEKS